MLISRNKVVRFDYTLTDDSAQVLDSSEGGEPLTYLHGGGNIIPGLESALEGKRAGESMNVRVAAAEAYGERDDALVQSVPREMFEDSDSIQVGMQFQSGDPDGNMRIVTVVSTDAASVIDSSIGHSATAAAMASSCSVITRPPSSCASVGVIMVSMSAIQHSKSFICLDICCSS